MVEIEALLRRSPRALGRALSVLERGGEPARCLLAALPSPISSPPIIGLTGPPGAGKSCLVEVLGGKLVDRHGSLAVLAVDPSSPFSGGALLGDRIRMPHLSVHPEVFLRSMATRGALGGLAAATADAVQLLAAAGFGAVLIETVGIGQDEVDIVHLADTVILAQPPGLGDELQAAKAGVMEIADLYCVSKADVPGADRVVQQLESHLRLVEPSGWRPPVLACSVIDRRGFTELAEALQEHRQYLESSGEQLERRYRRAKRRLLDAVGDAARRRAEADPSFQSLVAEIEGGAIDPYTASRRLEEL